MNLNLCEDEFKRSADSPLTVHEAYPMFQPIIDAQTGYIAGFECLVREIKPDQTLFEPEKLLNDIKLSGQNAALFFHMLVSAAEFIKEAALVDPDNQFYVSINVDVETLCDPFLANNIDAFLNAFGIDPSRIVIEMLEEPFPSKDNVDAVADFNNVVLLDSGYKIESYEFDQAVIINQLAAIESLGMSVAVDDFGAGASNIERVIDLMAAVDIEENFPLTIVKFDRKWMPSSMEVQQRKVSTSEAVDAIDASGIPMLAALSDKPLYLTFEGIETEEDYAVVTQSFPPERLRLQGFLFSEPLERVDALLALGMEVNYFEKMDFQSQNISDQRVFAVR